jgi:gluconate 2-dehydrogenase gamma chain
MMVRMNTRRSALKTIAAAAVGVPAAAQHQHTEPPLQITAAYRPRVFQPDEMKWVAKLVDLIIPRTDTPGASDARVPEYVDRALARNGSLKDRFKLGMGRLNDRAKQDHGAAFDALTDVQQIALLTEMSEAPDTALGRFFKLAKSLTIDGYYTSQEGLKQELGWNANTYLPEFKGCTHPEHQG